MTPQATGRLRRALVVLALASGVWGAVVALTGGVVLDFPGLAITSRNPRNPLLIALVAAIGAWALPMPDRRRALQEAWRRGRAVAIWPRDVWPRLGWLEPAVVVAVAFASFDVFLWSGGRPLWLDEEMLALNLRDRGFSGLSGSLWLGQSAPFGWLVLERAMLVVFGTGERVLRAVPLLFGCGLLATAVWVGRRFLSPWGALLFVLLCAVGRSVAHFRFELKHYSADAFWGLLLPILAIRVLLVTSAPAHARAAFGWWVAAAIGLWTANGALLAAPASALILFVAEWRRTGGPGAFGFARTGVLWAISAGLHYAVSLRQAATDQTLRDYWSAGFPPASAGLAGTLQWVAGRFEPLASSPGGTSAWLAFWVSATAGFLLAGRGFGTVLAAVPISAFAWGIFGIVPLHDRLALWIVPALYLGVAFLVEAAVRQTSHSTPPCGFRRSFAAMPNQRAVRLLLAAAAIGLVAPLSFDIVDRGWLEYRAGRWPIGNQGVDDRAAVRWLLSQQRRGDVVITTRMGAPAIWWYGGVDVRDPSAGRTLPDGTPMLQAALERERACARDPLLELLRGHQRALMYVGFPDEPEGFSDLLLSRLSLVGTVVAERRFNLRGHAAVVELGAPPPRDETRGRTTPPLHGCVVGEAAGRW